MASTALTVQTLSSAGGSEAHVAANADGNYVQDNDGNIYLDLSNHNGSTVNVTVHYNDSMTVDGQPIENVVISVPDGVSYWAGPYPPNAFNDENNRLQITYSDATNFSCLPMRVVPFPLKYNVS